VPNRETAPVGAPCWTDLWTSDVEGSRRFYSALFGWVAEEPSPEFGGYFMFTREGVPVAGGMGDMGDMGDMKANDTWKIYLSTDDIDKTTSAAESAGSDIVAPPMPVADLGRQVVFADPTGAHLGAWQPGTFPGFTVLDEPGAPSWFELHTKDYPTAVDFYRTVFHLGTDVVADTDEFRYSTFHNPSDPEAELGGIMDASGFLLESVPSYWVTYWEVADVDHKASEVTSLGGSVLEAPTDTPYGRMATVKDPAGAIFKLRTGPAQ
jgi:predicted enzyme related to lactoylglutathione lyase